MSDIETRLITQLKACESTPFLFVGSGISQRYIKTERWEELLRLFASYARPGEDFAYELYKEPFRHSGDTANVYLPEIATRVEADFNRIWFTDSRWEASRKKNREIARTISPFKIAIAEHFASKVLDPSLLEQHLLDEILLIKTISEKSVSGIITTNYDTLLESIFDKFKVFIGQEELLFSNPQSIAEIYKIHGCCSKPDTITINSYDYQSFSKRNAYLAAKLLTIFVEHPVVFLGYSLNDPDVEEILKSILECLSATNLGILENRLIFVEYQKSGDTPTVSTHDKSFSGGKTIRMLKITTKDYSPIFSAIAQNRAKYPTNILRKLKEDIYRLILTNDPKGELFVKEFEDIRDVDHIEIVAGVGIIREMGEKGYDIITNDELYRDVVLNDQRYNHQLIVERTLPRLFPIHTNSVPIYKYIAGIPIENIPDSVQEKIKTSYDDFMSNTVLKNRAKYKYYSSVDEIIKSVPFPKCLDQIALLYEEEVDINQLESYLKQLFSDHPDVLKHEKPNTRTSLRRIIKIYDWLKYYKEKDKQKCTLIP